MNSVCKNCKPSCPTFIFSHRELGMKCPYCGCTNPEPKQAGEKKK